MKKIFWTVVVILFCGVLWSLVPFWRGDEPPVVHPPQKKEAVGSNKQPMAHLSLAVKNAQVIRDCLQDHLLSSYFESNHFDLKDFLRKESQAELLVDQEVLHYRSSEGDFRAIAFPSQTDEAKEPLRLFKVDTDGYPTAIARPTEWKNLRDQEILQRIRNQYSISKHQEKARVLIPSSMQMEVEIENDVIKTMSVHFQQNGQTRFLGCDLRESLSHQGCVCR